MKHLAWICQHPLYAACWFVTGNTWSHVFAK